MSVYNKKLKSQCLVLACPEGGRWSNIQLLSMQTVKYERFYLSQNINGLVCWLKNSFDDNNKYAYICNPSTRELTKLPLIHRTTRSSGRSYSSYHFGFDPSSKAFQVLNIRISRIVGRPYFVACHIYTLGGKSWRRIHSALPFVCNDDLPWSLSSLKSCLCLNGALHWIHLDMIVIVVFDLKDEKFRIIPLPKSVVFRSISPILLLQVDGNLVVACIPEDLYNYRNMKMELWTLEDYQREVWIKEDIIIPFRCDLNDSHVYAIPTLGKIWLKPTTLFNDESSGEDYLAEFFYDAKNKSFSSIRIPELSEGFLPYVQSITNHTESIFSLSSQQTKALSRSGKKNHLL
ncbi:unnamed protein product [Ilex paraguariensis]|uniref:F-box associated beta-propeller type 3 domain-containing protein n=1 Tax=Ilex paraguariensis TaxID=185542 RepID=A0ABC8S264_9AQUA